MSEPIRMLHFADIHVGMENYGRTDPGSGLSTRVVDFLRRLDEMIDYARNHEVDLTIFAGDAFKTRSPNPTFQREFAWRVRDLAELAPLVLLVGNHDLAPTLLKASSIEIYDTLAVPNVWVASEYEVRAIETRRGPVAIGTGPYPLRSRLLQDENVAGMTIAHIDALLQEKLMEIIDGLAEEADALGDMPRVFTGHFSIGGALLGSERGIMLGRDIEVPLSALADNRWDYVALGHIHKHQNLTRSRDSAPPVVYSGSMERIDFGEEGDPKGFCWVELSRGAAAWEFVPVAARRFVTLDADLRTSHTPTEDVLTLINRHNLLDAVVRLRLQLLAEQEPLLREYAIRDALRQAGISHLGAIIKQIEQPDRARLGANPEGLTHAELLDRYLLSREVPAARREAILERAAGIFEEVGGL